MPPRDYDSSAMNTTHSKQQQQQQQQHSDATPFAKSHISFDDDKNNANSTRKWLLAGISTGSRTNLFNCSIFRLVITVLVPCTIVWICLRQYYYNNNNNNNNNQMIQTTTNRTYPSGQYQLVDRQVGVSFLDAYEFFDGPDSIGSAGYNVYVNRHRAEQIGIVNVTKISSSSSTSSSSNDYDNDNVFMKSSPTIDGPRESIRLEGKDRYNHGLFIADLVHMPVGCGQWPAFWLTDDNKNAWPYHGEIDIVEGINYQNNAKTALHTSDSCSMWQQVAPYSKTGYWDRADGLFDRYSGVPQNDSSIPADNCYVKATHQWSNQGCVTISEQNNTIGSGFNQQQGGIYVLEWDPYNGYIRSWVFPRSSGIPLNIQSSIDTSTSLHNDKNAQQQQEEQTTTSTTTTLDPNDPSWGLPYAYFAIGDHSDCTNDHFQNMRLIFNLAFCGTVSGNRFFNDCPTIAKMYSSNPNLQNNPIGACNAYIQSNPSELDEAYWQINGVYVYQRT
jgi:Glycosyl hydrolases family 16